MLSSMNSLRLGVVGCGPAGQTHLRALRRVSQIEVTCLADVDAATCEKVASKYSVPRCYQDVHQMLKSEALDIVACCAPPGAHLEVALAVRELGIPLYLEKPITLTLEEAHILMESAGKGAFWPVQIGFYARFHPPVQKAKQILARHFKSSPRLIRSTLTGPPYSVQPPDWRREPATGGCVFTELAIHHLDLWRFLLGAEIETLRSTRLEKVGGILEAKLSNGTTGILLVDRASSDCNQLEIIGDGGRLWLDLYRFDGLDFIRPGEVPGATRDIVRCLRSGSALLRSLRFGGSHSFAFQNLWRSFARNLQDGTPPAASLEDGFLATRWALQAQEQAQTSTSK